MAASCWAHDPSTTRKSTNGSRHDTPERSGERHLVADWTCRRWDRRRRRGRLLFLSAGGWQPATGGRRPATQCSIPKICGRMAERFSWEARSGVPRGDRICEHAGSGGNLGEVVEGERRRPRPAKRQPRVAQRHRENRSGQTPRVTILAKQKYVTVFSELST